MTGRTHLILTLFLAVIFISCQNEESKNTLPVSVNPETMKVADQGGRKLRGQVLYMPVYSNIPHLKKQDYDLSAFLAIHNTDLTHQIKITKVDYFNTDGKLIKNFIASDQQIDPLATKIFTIPKEDQSGTGANFLVEWIAEQPVNEPLIESVMKDLSGNKGISFLSQGRIIREIE
ncbi:MAG TPA: DUF3124 domain-containing protein [Smithella sp.]|nr:DUF3124 domain-containing protein [Smithella sp.]MDM7986988.1 DUF3124 domain-containing protein [Smithella sp.]HNY50175.1 DUF3124 domain-containing protein [Smithella sp.]HOG89508.1 DUF3124 domain-containing protein [Smithella sp.]HOU51789.1 DUF3124 domain-containing protein [Smithella sp.]